MPNANNTNTGAARRTKKRTFPFTTIIVTNPDEASAESAQTLLDATLKRYLNNSRHHNFRNRDDVRIISTCDPYGARCGSFGGTLAALELIPTTANGDWSNETVLCLHAGGDSSRCPLSMILGKAWTNLPSADFRNPIAWLISQLEDLFNEAQIPSGSLLVTSTDCLISLGESTIDDNNVSANSATTAIAQKLSESDLDPFLVLGVAVPAPLTTAKNHGVFVMPEESLSTSATKPSDAFKIRTPTDVWQKPGVDQMLDKTLPTPGSFDVPYRSGKQAWIDVGIVVFCPGAFRTLRSLSTGLLSLCTRRGLDAAYHAASAESRSSLESFAKSKALKVDLYTDVLHNLPLGESATRESTTNGDTLSDETNVKSSLKRELSALSLRVLMVPKGSFLHLGTTRELIEFITTSPTTAEKSKSERSATIIVPPIMDTHVTQNLARALRLDPRFESVPQPNTAEEKNNTTLCSTFPSDAMKTQLGSSTFVEYSDLREYDSVTIGNHCMLSGWRSADPEEIFLNIPDTTSVQLLPLVSVSPETDERVIDEEERWVMMVLGTTDSIKSSISKSELYGVPFADFVDRTGMSNNALGFGDDLTKDDSLWTAKIHPIVCSRNQSSSSTISFSSMFGWLEKLRTKDSNISSDESFSNWFSTERVSLKDIHGISDASKEWAFRMGLEKKIWRLKYQRHIETILTLLRNRCQTVPCDLSWLTENNPDKSYSFTALSALVDALEDLALEEFADANYDVSGRALMLASAAIADFPPERLVGGDSSIPTKLIPQYLIPEDHHRNISTDRKSIVQSIFGVRKSEDWKATEESMSVCSEKLERLALEMTELTITAGFQKYLDPSVDAAKNSMIRTSTPIVDRCVLSVAPVRVDLAGGWSDTPPITYEHGGSVTGMAVLVDGCFPLSCRCRIVSGGTGIFLKTELRELSTGSLLSSRQENVRTLCDLRDFRNPSASCALLKAALVCLGMVSEEDLRLLEANLQERINEFCSSAENVRLEIISTSLLGMGTGMGTSSILGACVLQSLATCLGIGTLSDDCIIHAVLFLEQLMSSGGGWQDQAHGIVPGIKLVTSAPKIPLAIDIDQIALSHEDVSAFEDRLMFAYTGKTRLAKNILQQVLRRWARRTPEIVQTVNGLVEQSQKVRSALESQSWDALGEHLYKAYKLKCVMAGEGSGAEPESVKLFVSEMMQRGQIQGAMLCGAGGGGFLLLLLSENVDRTSVEKLFESSIRPLSGDFADFSFHNCAIAQSGLTTSVLPHDEVFDTETYNLSWQQP